MAISNSKQVASKDEKRSQSEKRKRSGSVDSSDERPKSKPAAIVATTSIAVSNVPLDFNEQMMSVLFASCEGFKSVELVEQGSGKLEFESSSFAEAAFRQFHGYKFSDQLPPLKLSFV